MHVAAAAAMHTEQSSHTVKVLMQKGIPHLHGSTAYEVIAWYECPRCEYMDERMGS